jgi:outer membrane protein with beta-barrel domain
MEKEGHMARKLLAALAVVLFAATSAFGQERGIGAGRVEIGAFPGGGMFVTKTTNGNEPAFGNYALGGSFTWNVNRWVGLEGEGGGTLGVRQAFTFGDTAYTNQRPPSTWMYHGNAVVNPRGSDRVVVPYLTGGLGGITLSPHREARLLGIENYKTFLAGNLGGGVKWFAAPHLGLRGDYRLFVVRNNDTAPLFFGNETRYGHRVQGGLVFTY